MGQGQFHDVTGQVALFTDRLKLRAAEIRQVTALTYASFLESITLLNEFAENFNDGSDKKLAFIVKRGTDDSIFWRSTVRVRCCKINAQTGAVELTKLLTLKQYLRIYDEIKRYVSEEASATDQPADLPSCSNMQKTNLLDASVIMTQIDAAFEDSETKEEEECIICMDRKSTTILPCAHSYCEQCIDAWQDSHKTCPVCRAVVNSSKESWVLSEKPDEQEVANEASNYVMGLIDRHPNDSDSSDQE